MLAHLKILDSAEIYLSQKISHITLSTLFQHINERGSESLCKFRNQCQSLPAFQWPDCYKLTSSDQTQGWRHSKPPSLWSRGWRSWSSRPPFPARSTASACELSLRWSVLVAGSKAMLTAKAAGRGWGTSGQAQPGWYIPTSSHVITMKLLHSDLLHCTSLGVEFAFISEAHLCISDSSSDLYKELLMTRLYWVDSLLCCSCLQPSILTIC